MKVTSIRNMDNLKERRKMKQIEEQGVWGVKSVTIPTFRMKENLLTNDERKLYRCLEEIYKDTDIRISIQVSLNQLIELNTRRYYSTEKRDCIANKFKGLSIDFVLFNINTCNAICCIELNGKEHEFDEARIERDTFLKETFSLLEIPLIFIKSMERYSQEEIYKIISIETGKDKNM